MKRRQQGITTVEFAIVGATALVVLIGCIEIGRMLFVWNTIAEATRRGARVAAVTAMDSADITAAVLTFSPYLTGMTSTNVSVTYTDETGTETAVSNDVKFVTVAIAGYAHTLLIPFVGSTVTVPPFTTTVPAESKGFDPDP